MRGSSRQDVSQKGDETGATLFVGFEEVFYDTFRPLFALFSERTTTVKLQHVVEVLKVWYLLTFLQQNIN